MTKKLKWVAVVVEPHEMAQAIVAGADLARQGIMRAVFLTGQDAMAAKWLERQASTESGLAWLQDMPGFASLQVSSSEELRAA